MNMQAVKVLSWLLVLFGAFLVYDSLFVFLMAKLSGSRYYIGLDFKELMIGSACIGGGFFWLRHANLLAGRARDIAVVVLAAGLFIPMLFEVNLRKPLWFTSRQEVTIMSGADYGDKLFMRSRLLQFADSGNEPVAIRDNDVVEAVAAAVASATAAEDPLPSSPRTPNLLERIESAGAVARLDDRQSAARAAYTARREQQRLESIAAAQQRASNVLPAASVVQLPPKPENVAEPSLSSATASQPPGEPVSGEFDMGDGCGNNNDVLAESNALVEQASGSLSDMSIAYVADSETMLLRAIELDSRNVLAFSRLGRYYMDQRDDPAAAIKVYKQALETMPDCHALYFSLGSAYSASEAYPEAREALATAIARSEAVPASYYYNLGNAYLKSGDSVGSIEPYRQALAADPSHRSANVNLTHAYLNEGMTQEMHELHKGDYDALRRIGVTLNRAKKHHEALSFFEASLAAREEAETYVQIGVANGMLKNWDEARYAADSALALDPGNVVAQTVLRLVEENQ